MGWFHDEYGEDAHPILPIELANRIYDLWHDEDAMNDIIRKVQDGRMSVDDVRRALDRPDIEPEDWQDFEEGWRPDGW